MPSGLQDASSELDSSVFSPAGHRERGLVGEEGETLGEGVGSGPRRP